MKLSLSTPLSYVELVEVELHSFLTSALDGSVQMYARPL